MKRLNILAIIMFFIVGCATEQPQIQIEPDSQVVIAKIAGRRAGYQLESRYPEVSHEVLSLSKAILIEKEPDIVRIVIDRLIVVLASGINDPMLSADLNDILALIKIETGVEITDEYMLIVRATAEGLISGIEIFQQQNINIKIGE